MKVEYKKILINSNYIGFIVKATIVTFLFNIFTVIFLITTLKAFEKRFESKYSYSIAKNYFKGTITNPYAFIQSANIYKLQGKPDKELEELNFALSLYQNMLYKDKEKIKEINERIKILVMKKNNEN